MHGETERGVVRVGALLHHHRLVTETAATTAVLLGQVEAQKPGSAGFVPKFSVHLLLFRPPGLVGSRFLAEELGGVLAQEFLILGLPRNDVVRE